MHLNYGNQGEYRALGIHPRCGICRWYVEELKGEGPCSHPTKPQVWVPARGCCFNFEREPGADDDDVRGPVK